MPDRYISVKDKVNGFSFANLGIFRGFGDGIYSAVYSLVILSILGTSAAVGIYVAIYSAAMMLITMFATETYKYFSKANIFYVSMLSMAVLFFMMGFSVKDGTFIALDYASGIAAVFVGMILPLFMSDFSKNIGMEKLSGRYTLWVNTGALFAPMIAMFFASNFGERSAFLISGVIYFFGFLIFKNFRIIQEDKKAKKINPHKTARALWDNTVQYFRTKGMTRAYLVSFGFRFLANMRHIYVPIIVIENGFTKETLGWVLTLGIIPYILLAEPLGRLASRYGSKLWLAIGFILFAAFSFWAVFATGWTMLLIFVLWQIPGAFIEPLSDLPFFDAAKEKEKRAKFFGTFRTSTMLPRFIAPLVGAGFIIFFGGTSAVWITTGIMGLLSAWILLAPARK